MSKVTTFDAALLSARASYRPRARRITPKSAGQNRNMLNTRSKPAQFQQSQVGFTFAIIALASNMMKRDGEVCREKFSAFFDTFPMKEREVEKTKALMIRMMHDAPQPSLYVKQIKELFPNRADVYGEVVSRLMSVAAAGHEMDGRDELYLYEVSQEFGLDETRWQVMLSRYGLNIEQKNPYDILGVSRNASNEMLKTRYRILSRKYHPDNHLAGAANTKQVKWLNQKMAKVNHAYETIMKARGMKKAVA